MRRSLLPASSVRSSLQNQQIFAVPNRKRFNTNSTPPQPFVLHKRKHPVTIPSLSPKRKTNTRSSTGGAPASPDPRSPGTARKLFAARPHVAAKAGKKQATPKKRTSKKQAPAPDESTKDAPDESASDESAGAPADRAARPDHSRLNRFNYAYSKAQKPNLGYSKQHLKWLEYQYTAPSEPWEAGTGLWQAGHRCEGFVSQPGFAHTPSWMDVTVIGYRSSERIKINDAPMFFVEVTTKMHGDVYVLPAQAVRVFPCRLECCNVNAGFNQDAKERNERVLAGFL